MASSNDNLKSAAETYGELLMEKKRLEAELKKLEPTLKEALADKGTVNIGNYSFTAKTSAGRKTLDKKLLGEALTQHGLELTAFEKQGAPFVTMTVEETTTL